MIDKIGIQQPSAIGTDSKISHQKPNESSEVFKGLLDQKLTDTSKPEMQKALDSLKFSSHAIERMQSRGIHIDPKDLQKLNDAVDKAAEKGSKETLVIMGDNAFVVSAKNKTVITAMDKNMMKQNVFTNIDSTILV